MTEELLQPFFLDGSRGRIFVMLRSPAAASRCVLFVPPFGEEMNRCRRQITETAQRLVASGLSAVIPDLFGTGDSEGEFSHASWEGWVDDIRRVGEWVQSEAHQVEAIVAIRLGCSLAAEAVASSSLSVQRTVFWQPVYSGSDYLRHFLRLRVAASIGTGMPETVNQLEARLASGETVEIAGYTITPALYESLRDIELDASASEALGRLRVFQVKRNVISRNVKPVGRAKSDHFGALYIVQGEPFWASNEVVTNAELSARTVEAILREEDESL